MATKNSPELVSCKEEDFLDQDPPLRGQNYVCLSFISPEAVLKRKDTYFIEKFLGGFSQDMTEFFDNLKAKYPDDAGVLKAISDRYSYVFNPDKINEEYSFYMRVNSEKLEKEFYEKNQFQTSVRGLKVRGVFDTRKEAEVRAQVLKKYDDKFSVYVAEVGCWLPWNPNPDEIEDQEFAESELNTLMKKYRENQSKKDVFFQERLKESVLENTRQKLAADGELKAFSVIKEESDLGPGPSTSVAATATATELSTDEMVKEIEKPDAWSQVKLSEEPVAESTPADV